MDEWTDKRFFGSLNFFYGLKKKDPAAEKIHVNTYNGHVMNHDRTDISVQFSGLNPELMSAGLL